MCCFARNTSILMYDGNSKLIQDLIRGDIIMGSKSIPKKIKDIIKIKSKNTYNVITEYNDKIICDEITNIPIINKITKQISHINIKRLCDYFFLNTIYFTYKTPIEFYYYEELDFIDKPYEAGKKINKHMMETNINKPFNSEIEFNNFYKNFFKRYKFVSIDERKEIIRGLFNNKNILSHYNILIINEIEKMCKSIGYSVDRIDSNTIKFYINSMERLYITRNNNFIECYEIICESNECFCPLDDSVSDQNFIMTPNYFII